MNVRKKLMCMLAAALVVVSLSACSQEGNTPNEGIGNDSTQGGQDQLEQQDGQLPPAKELELELEGSKELKTAQLMSGSGYSIYVFDIFTFDAPAGKLTMNVDENYSVEISKLPSGYNSDELRRQAEEELAALGEIRDEQEPMMEDAHFVLAATKDQLTKRIIFKEIEGNGYVFKLNVPQGEPTEGFNPHAYAMLNSIVNQ